MNSCCGFRCPHDMDISSVSLSQERKIMKMARKPNLTALLKKMPPKPQKTARLFQPKLERTQAPSMVASRKERVKDIKVAAPPAAGGPRSGSGPKPGRNHRGGRLFDRQSGSNCTGVKAVDKRNGAGAHNWGSPEQEIELEGKMANWRTSSNKRKPTRDVSVQSKWVEGGQDSSEEPEQFTLDEWRVMQKKKLLEKDQEKLNENEKASEGSVGGSGRQLRLVDVRFNFSTKPGPVLKISDDNPEFCPKANDEGQFPNLS
ncbi:hypothetical protein KR084_010415 [Drosophila pseudotakahashii]|nr:hypothetical protein KR084_010415 [Drosophila pseudotakahashii]